MNAQSGNSWQIVFALQEACDPLFDEFMENFFAASACDYTDDGKVRYIGYSSAPVDEPRMAQAAAAFGLALPAWRSEFIPAANWLTKNVIRFRRSLPMTFTSTAPTKRKFPIQTSTGCEYTRPPPLVPDSTRQPVSVLNF